MDALPMDDVPPCADCTEAEDNDHLNQLANVAVGAARAVALKRRAESKAGRDVCWVVGCGCAEGLLGVPKAFLADASHIMLNEMLIDFGKSRGKARELPQKEACNKLCAEAGPARPWGRCSGRDWRCGGGISIWKHEGSRRILVRGCVELGERR